MSENDYAKEKLLLMAKTLNFLENHNEVVEVTDNNVVDLTLWGEKTTTELIRLYIDNNGIRVDSRVNGEEDTDVFGYFDNEEMKTIMKVFGVEGIEYE